MPAADVDDRADARVEVAAPLEAKAGGDFAEDDQGVDDALRALIVAGRHPIVADPGCCSGH